MEFDTKRRVLLVYICFIIVVLVVFGAYIYYNTIAREDLRKVAETTTVKQKEVPAQRGSIYSCDGSLMSTTLPLYKLYMDTQVEYLSGCKSDSVINIYIDSLSYCLSKKFKNKTPAEYKRYIMNGFHKKNRVLPIYPKYVSYFDYVEVSQFPLFRLGKYKGGLTVEIGNRRQHTFGNLCESTIGNIYGNSGKGRSGLELYFNDELQGKDGLANIIKFGNTMYKRPIIDPVDGSDIYTTINVDMQDICESELKKTLKLHGCDRACMVLMEVKTGKIRAMVNLSKDVDGEYKEHVDDINMAISDLSTPGSTFKTMSLMIALENNLCDTNDVVSTGNGIWYLYNSRIRDSNYRKGGHGDITITNILAQSSNIGVMKIIQKAYGKHPEKFLKQIVNTKFAEDIELMLPNAQLPVLPDVKKKNWSNISLAWTSIGYESLIPPIYTLNFYNAIANNGVMVRPYIVEKIVSSDDDVTDFDTKITNSSICSLSTLHKIQDMLRYVVQSDSGTAHMINNASLPIAGKTGTAILPNGGGDQISFCGYFPADKPVYSAIVVVKHPRTLSGAGYICATTFYRAAKKIYAMNLKQDISDFEVLADSGNIPSVKAGNAVEVTSALKKLNFKVKSTKANWITTTYNGDAFIPQEVSVADGIVPNVYGMAAVDALYLLEKSGLRVVIYGKGKVVSQSISPGTKVKKGETIHLKLTV